MPCVSCFGVAASLRIPTRSPGVCEWERGALPAHRICEDRMRSVSLVVLVALCRRSAAIDAVHKHMEPAMPYPSKPYVRHPLGAQAAVGGTGLLAAAGRLVTRRRLLALLPVAVGTAIVTQPTLMERLLLHFICFIGSLFEPYDSILPKKSFLKFFIRAVQKAKRDYDVKHGLVPPRPSTLSVLPACPPAHSWRSRTLLSPHSGVHRRPDVL